MTRKRIDEFVLGEGRLRDMVGGWSGGRRGVMRCGSSSRLGHQFKAVRTLGWAIATIR